MVLPDPEQQAIDDANRRQMLEIEHRRHYITYSVSRTALIFYLYFSQYSTITVLMAATGGFKMLTENIH